MSARRCTVSFGDAGYEPVELSENANLSEELDVQNSPLLFGCRTGICGTCLIEVEGAERLPPPDEDEAEMLEVLAPHDRRARLACQLRLTCDIRVRPHPEGG